MACLMVPVEQSERERIRQQKGEENQTFVFQIAFSAGVWFFDHVLKRPLECPNISSTGMTG